MEPVILGEIGACMHVLLLALCVNVGSKLRKTPGTWLSSCAGRMCLAELTIGLNFACLVAVFRVAELCLQSGSPLSAELGDWSISLTQRR